MQRFLRQENIARLERFLQFETVERSRRALLEMLRAERRELALLDAALRGLPPGSVGQGQGGPSTPAMPRRFRDEFEASLKPFLLLDPRAGLHIVDANSAYRDVTMTGESIFGRPLFEVFPDNPADPGADGVSNLFASLRATLCTGQAQTMAVQRYDVRDQAGHFVERHWRPVNTPIFDDEHRLVFLLHHVEDVTAEVTQFSAPPPARLRA